MDLQLSLMLSSVQQTLFRNEFTKNNGYENHKKGLYDVPKRWRKMSKDQVKI